MSERPPEEQKLLGRALQTLGRKERTEAEMRVWLSARAEDPDLVERVVAFLIENLALDDVRFSREYANDKRDLAGWGAERIESTLRARGIERTLAREAATNGNDSEVERALRVLVDRGVQVGTDRERGRALGMLARRGYSAEDAYAAIRQARHEQEADQKVRFDDCDSGTFQIDL